MRKIIFLLSSSLIPFYPPNFLTLFIHGDLAIQEFIYNKTIATTNFYLFPFNFTSMTAVNSFGLITYFLE